MMSDITGLQFAFCSQESVDDSIVHVSYSLYGNKVKYLDGLHRSLLAIESTGDKTLRAIVYYDSSTVPVTFILRMKELFQEIAIFCDMITLGLKNEYKTLYRYRAFEDPSFCRVVILDVDCCETEHFLCHYRWAMSSSAKRTPFLFYNRADWTHLNATGINFQPEVGGGFVGKGYFVINNLINNMIEETRSSAFESSIPKRIGYGKDEYYLTYILLPFLKTHVNQYVIVNFKNNIISNADILEMSRSNVAVQRDVPINLFSRHAILTRSKSKAVRSFTNYQIPFLAR